MPFVANFPFVCILITMASGVLCSILKGKKAFFVNVFVSFTCFILNLLLLLYLIKDPQEFTFMMGHYPAPWGNEITFGPFEVLMATVFSLVMGLISLSEKERVFEKIKHGKENLFYLLLNLMLSSTLALIFTNDLFTSYVFIEINTLCACGLVMAKETRKTIAATIKYLIMSLLGSGLFLVSIILIYDLTGHLLLPNVGEVLSQLIASGEYRLPITIILGLMSVGLAIKSALFPFHTWVPNAYNRAMNVSNSLSSSLVMKSYIVLLIKLFTRVIGLENLADLRVLNILFTFGIIAMIIGSIDALRDNNIKRILAYSSVAQIGYIYVAIGLGTTQGLVAAGFIILSHSLVKSMLFTACEGLMKVSDNSKFIIDLKGSAYRNKIAGIAFAIGGFTLIGFPMLSGFTGKYLLATAGILNSTKMWFVLIALAISTLLNALYFIRIITVIYTKSEQKTDYNNSNLYKIALSFLILVNLMIVPFQNTIISIIQSGIKIG